MEKKNCVKGVFFNIRSCAFWGYMGIFCLYLLTRILAWQNTFLLEDYDSIYLLNDAKAFLSRNLQNIIQLRPDATPLYPFFSALFGSFGWSLEFSARLCSLFFSVILFWAVAGIGQTLARPLATAFGLLILTFSPVLIPFSYSILTEPSYLGVVYLGLWFFFVQHRNLRLKSAFWLGCVFGASFLSRTEGLFYVFVIPLLQVGHYALVHPRPYSFRKVWMWLVIYILSFGLVASLQIWRVSHKMGFLAINGRQVWTLILKNPDHKSYDEKIYGLNYSPTTVNIHYVQKHPEIIRKIHSGFDLKSFVKSALVEFNELYQKNLGILIGPLGIAFFAIGLLSLYQRGLRYECVLIIGFIGLSLVAPLAHSVWIRHIAIIAPLMHLVAGIGIMRVSDVLVNNSSKKEWKGVVIPGLCLIATVGAFILPLRKIYGQPITHNFEYNPERIARFVDEVHRFSQEHSISHPKVMARKNYLGYYAGADVVSMPFADYGQLVTYCQMNQVDFVLLEHRLVKDFPFYQQWITLTERPHFELLQAEVDEYGQQVELYYFKDFINSRPLSDTDRGGLHGNP